MIDHGYKIYTSHSPGQQSLTPVSNNTTQNSSLPQFFTTDVNHDQIQNYMTNTILNSTSHLDNKIIPSHRRHHPQRIKNYTRDV